MARKVNYIMTYGEKSPGYTAPATANGNTNTGIKSENEDKNPKNQKLRLTYGQLNRQ
ncbi:hypothetical protein BH10ACI2_BH10ACI2_05740 [soil metagenome]